MILIQSILLFICGLLMLKYSFQIKKMTGSWAWAEKLIGYGGTHLAIKIIGLLFIVASILWLTGTLDLLFQGTVGRILAPRVD